MALCSSSQMTDSDLLQVNDLQMIVRAHECVMDGFERFAQGHLITLFSATNYCGTANNAGTALRPLHACQIFCLAAARHALGAETVTSECLVSVSHKGLPGDCRCLDAGRDLGRYRKPLSAQMPEAC